MGVALAITGFFATSTAAYAEPGTEEKDDVEVPHKRPAGLLDEVMLHPLDASTGYVLRKGEVIYNQSPMTLPFPSWSWIGVTDWFTLEIDTLPLLGGLFVGPHLPVPSVNGRFRIRQGGADRVAVAAEVMMQHMWNEAHQEDMPHFDVFRRGTDAFARINVSWPITPRVRIHASAGATWAEYYRIRNKDRTEMLDFTYENRVTPDLSIALDVRAKPWLSLHATAAMGTTFVYSDNQPGKLQATYGFRIAPFYWARTAVLRTFRAEFPALFIYRPDIKELAALHVPIFPYLYWQFQL